MSEFPSGNLARDTGLTKVVQAATVAGEPITSANISLHCRQEYGDTFSDVSDTELAECVAFITPPAAEPEAEPAQVGIDPNEPEREPPTMTRNEAALMVQDAQLNLLAARREHADKMTAQKAARGALSVAVMAWQRGGEAQPSREQLQREYIASEQARKLAGVSGRVRPTPGPSIIDQHAAYSTGGDANTFARKQMRHGSHHRAVFIDGKWQRPRQRGSIVPSEG